ncbi:hypothetical protein NQ317_009584 [Molorchus minor]|uniref:Nbr1 FW domain-containing protein n=1 Tax=Molorchus minor TaxID=1323400 RepID=A0ABQ9J6C7_9CUCU|nr:hypothetical protein NQ317_009584 [Molorchus minor]
MDKFLGQKDLIKSLKLDSKLERKLEKLEHKTKKLKEKKVALLIKSSDSDAGPSSSRSQSHRHSEDFDQFDAVPINTQSVIPHMVGGEIYLHQWKVMNTGSCPWTNDGHSKRLIISNITISDNFEFYMGCKSLKPLDLFIHVPHFKKPDETGTLSVRLQIPNQPGQYECYWHFNHKGRRFGHWLGCQVIVDPFDLKGAQSVLERSFMTEFITTTLRSSKLMIKNTMSNRLLHNTLKLCQVHPLMINNRHPEASEETVENDDASNVLNRLMRDISARVEDIKLEDPTDTNCSSDSDNQSIISLSESNSSKSIPEEFVVVPIPDCFKIDPVNNVASENIKEQINKCNDAVVSGGVEETSQVQTDKTNIEQDPDNFDNNNNSEEIDKNASTSGSIIKADDDASSCEGSQKSDIVIVTLPDDKELDEAEYAYVLIDGHKVPIPKKIIKSEYLQSAEGTLSTKGSRTRTVSSASSIEIVNKEDETPQEETTSVIGEQIQSPTYTEVENKKR